MSEMQQYDRGTVEIADGAPQFHERTSTASIMWFTVLCLLPAAVWGVYVFGAHAAAVLGIAIATAVLLEFVLDRVMHRPERAGQLQRASSVRDGSALLSGLLIGMSMPPQVPLFIPVVASAFAMVVVKWTFGGLGANWMNPALAGRVFVFFSWSGAMTRWVLPQTLTASGSADVVSGATPLGLVKAAVLGGNASVGGPMALLQSAGFPRSALDVHVTEWLNTNIFGPLGASLPGGYIDPFVGNVSGSIGEVSALLLLLGSILMFGRRIITWEIPGSYFLSFALFTWIFGGLQFGAGLFHGDVLFGVLTGGFMIALFYMATDPVTSPMSTPGMIIYGSGVGLFTFLFRSFGAYPEGVALAIILMNVFVPLINRFTAPRRYGLNAAVAVRRGRAS